MAGSHALGAPELLAFDDARAVAVRQTATVRGAAEKFSASLDQPLK